MKTTVSFVVLALLLACTSQSFAQKSSATQQMKSNNSVITLTAEDLSPKAKTLNAPKSGVSRMPANFAGELTSKTGERGYVTPFGPPCTIVCTGTPEGEVCGDSDNEGCVAEYCQDAQFTAAMLGDTFCGTAWADGGVRDLDYYQIDVASITNLSFSITSEFPSNLLLIETAGAGTCAGLVVVDVVDTAGCATATLEATVRAGTYYALVTTGDAAGAIFDGIPCGGSNAYQLDLAGTPADCLNPTGTPEMEACGQDVHSCDPAALPAAREAIMANDSISGTVRTFIDPTTMLDTRDLDWFEVTMPAGDNDVTIDFTSEFPGTLILLSDDSAAQGNPECTNLLQIGEVFSAGCNADSLTTVLPGGTFYLLVTSADALGPIFDGIGDCTDLANGYQFDITSAPAMCPTFCALPAATNNENEPCPAAPSDPDTVNGGCNSLPAVFGAIGLDESVIGSAWADAGTRDTDWYQLDTFGPETIELTVEAQTNVTVFLLVDLTGTAFATCDLANVGVAAAITTPDDCSLQNSGPINLPAGTYWIFAATTDAAGGAVFSGNPCNCGAQYRISVNTVTPGCPVPTGNCVANCATGEIDVELTAAGDYDGITAQLIDADGNNSGGPIVVAGSTLTGAVVNSSIPVPMDGLWTLEFTADCGGGSTADVIQCTVTTVTYAGEDNIIYNDELDGCIDSVAALEAALTAAGQSFITAPYIVDCHVDMPEGGNMWIMNGTFPNNLPLLADEGLTLANAIQGLTTSNGPINVYVEGGDVWGFDAPTALNDWDGVNGLEVDGNIVLDGDDTCDEVSGVATPIDTESIAGGAGGSVAYNHDNANAFFNGGSDDIDQLEVSAADLPAGSIATAVLNNFDPAMIEVAYPVAIAKEDPTDSTGRVISSSIEFGGFGGDQDALAVAYLEYFGATIGNNDPMFIRGNCNNDGAINIADAIGLLGIVFPPMSGPFVPGCEAACDANADGGINIADAISLLGSIFSGGTLPAPWPACGTDAATALTCDTPNTTTCP